MGYVGPYLILQESSEPITIPTAGLLDGEEEEEEEEELEADVPASAEEISPPTNDAKTDDSNQESSPTTEEVRNQSSLFVDDRLHQL